VHSIAPVAERFLGTLLISGLLLLAPAAASAHRHHRPGDPAPGYQSPDEADIVDDPGAEDYYDPGADDLAPPAPEGNEDPTTPIAPLVPVPKTATIPGEIAYVRADGKAAIPRGAPKRVRSLIAAANKIVGKPYKWGGGHLHLVDRGYDCSGAVSYALIGSSLLGGTMVSGQLARWGAAGSGRWVSVFANKGHVYLEVAGLRFDTSPVGDYAGKHGVRWRPVIGRRQGFHARHPSGL
jgi:hypothetical protein